MVKRSSTVRSRAARERRKSKFKKMSKPHNPRNRLIALLVVFVVAAASFIATLFNLQVVSASSYEAEGVNQRFRSKQIAAYRGSIVDRNGFVFAASLPSHQVVADPSIVTKNNPAQSAALLAPVLGMDQKEVEELLLGDSPTDRYSLIKKTLTKKESDRIKELRASKKSSKLMSGIVLTPDEDRSYPAGDLAKSIVGRVDPDEIGIFGIEEQFDGFMVGQPGTEMFEGGRYGSISVGDWKVDPAKAGFNVELSLDHRLQYFAEQTLIAHCDKQKADGATVVASEPATGEILVMASVQRNEDGECVVSGYNKALVDIFEPGSVIKPIIAAGAMDEFGLHAQSTIEVPSRIEVGGKNFVDTHPPHESAPFPISQILTDSMNVGTIKLAQKLGNDKMYEYLTSFGVKASSGLAVRGESIGQLREPVDWWGSDAASISIGQGMTTNALQITMIYNTFANKGIFQPPTLVNSLYLSDSEEHLKERPEPSVVVTSDTAGQVTQSLISVVENGTGKAAAIPGYEVAGKTGTAWKVFDDGSGKLGYGSDSNRRYVTTFAGYAPAKDPAFAMTVVVDEPKVDKEGGTAAAPIFSEIGAHMLRLYEVQPTSIAASDGKLQAAASGERDSTIEPVALATKESN